MKISKSLQSLVIVCFLLGTSCSSQVVPAGFPQKLVAFEVKLLNEGKPVQGATVAMVTETAMTYNSVGFTDSNGIAKLTTSVNTYRKSGIPPAAYKAIITYTPKTPSELPNEQFGKMSNAEIDAYWKKIDAERATMPKVVPTEWGRIESTPIKITVPEKGGNVTIEITDSKNHQQ
ncbi:MAG: hypothetical protein LBK06_00455 [Planctomycetaceae bacterium]|nr:hypothetical protein [Planctomycetaceae bacterium]